MYWKVYIPPATEIAAFRVTVQSFRREARGFSRFSRRWRLATRARGCGDWGRKMEDGRWEGSDVGGQPLSQALTLEVTVSYIMLSEMEAMGETKTQSTTANNSEITNNVSSEENTI